MTIRDLPPGILAEVAAHLEGAYPAEGCGLVVEAAGTLRVLPCENLADALHRQDPALFPRTSRTSYAIDPRHLWEVAERGERVRVIYHSHCDAPAEISAEDRRLALAEPGLSYLIMSVVSGVAVALEVFEPTSRSLA